MASKKTIAVAQIHKIFSRYLNGGIKTEYYLYEDNEEDDDDIQIDINPLSGSKNNNDCCSTENNLMLNESMVETKQEQIQLSFDCQKEDEDIIGFDFENGDHIGNGQLKRNNEQVDGNNEQVDGNSSEKLSHVDEQIGHDNSTENLLHVLEGIDKCKDVVQIPTTDATSELSSLVDYLNDPTDSEVGDSLKNLICALANLETSTEEQSVDYLSENQGFCSVITDVKIPVINQEQNVCNEMDQERGDTFEKSTTDVVIPIATVQDNDTTQSLLRSSENIEECSDVSKQLIDNNRQQDTKLSVNDELNQYIKFYEQQSSERNTSTEQKLIGLDGGTEEITSIVEVIGTNEIPQVAECIDENTATTKESNEPTDKQIIPANAIVAAIEATDSVLPSQDKPQISELNQALSFDNPFVFDVGENVTSAQYAIMYEVVQDPNDPTLFSLRASTANNVSNLVLTNNECILPTKSSIPLHLIPSGITYQQRKQLMDGCSVLLKDCLVKKRRASLFDGMDFYLEDEIPQILPANLKPSPRLKPYRGPIQYSKPRKEKKSKKPEKCGDKVKKKCNVVVENKKKRNVVVKSKKKRNCVIEPPLPVEPPKSTPQTSITLDQQKTSTINEWLQSSHVTAPDNNVDVNELLQDANLAILSDIVSNFYLYNRTICLIS